MTNALTDGAAITTCEIYMCIDVLQVREECIALSRSVYESSELSLLQS